MPGGMYGKATMIPTKCTTGGILLEIIFTWLKKVTMF